MFFDQPVKVGMDLLDDGPVWLDRARGYATLISVLDELEFVGGLFPKIGRWDYSVHRTPYTSMVRTTTRIGLKIRPWSHIVLDAASDFGTIGFGTAGATARDPHHRGSAVPLPR